MEAPTEEQLLVLRAAVQKIRADSDNKITAPEIVAELHGDGEKWQWVSLNRVKKLITKLNKQQQGAAAASPAPGKHADLLSYPKWSVKEKLPIDLRKTSEILRSMNPYYQKSLTADVHLRHSQASLANFINENGCCGDEMLFLFRDEATESSMLLLVNEILRRPADGRPVLVVQFADPSGGSRQQQEIIKWAQLHDHVELPVNLEAQQLWVKLLSTHAEEIPQDVKSSERHQPRRSGLLLSFITLDSMQDADEIARESPVCGMCSKEMPLKQRKVCEACQGIFYCGRECQKQHWKQHKDFCKKRSEPEPGKSVVIPALEPEEMMHPQMRGMYRGSIGVGGQSHSSRSAGIKAPKNIHGDSKFIIKVQLPMHQSSSMPMMTYDKARSMQRMIWPGEAAYRPLSALIQSHGYQGVKAYFWSRREGEDLRIYVSSNEMPAQQQNW